MSSTIFTRGEGGYVELDSAMVGSFERACTLSTHVVEVVVVVVVVVVMVMVVVMVVVVVVVVVVAVLVY